MGVSLSSNSKSPNTSAAYDLSCFSIRRASLIGTMVLGSIIGSASTGCDSRPSSTGTDSTTTSQVNRHSWKLKDGVPANLTLDEKVLSIGTNMEVYADGQSFGRIDQKLMSAGKQFKFYGPNGELIASAKQRVLSWGVAIDVFDSSGSKIGTVKEKILKSLFSVKTEYAVESASGEEIATSEKLDLMATSFTVRDRSGNVVAEMSRPMINIGGDKWNIRFSGNVDRRLLSFMAAYKTASDNSK